MQTIFSLLGESFVSLRQFDKTLKSSALTISSVVATNKGEQELAMELNQKINFDELMSKAKQMSADLVFMLIYKNCLLLDTNIKVISDWF